MIDAYRATDEIDEARRIIEPIVSELFSKSALRTQDRRQAAGRALNAALVKLATARIALKDKS